MAVPSVKFNNGLEIPALGLGTWKSKEGNVTDAIKAAIDAGYRHIDSAYAYMNEKEAGEGIAAKIADGTIKREDIFVTSKLWNTFHRRDLVKGSVKESLANLGLDYLDLYLIHWPMSYQEGTVPFPKDDNGKFIYSDSGFLDAWKAMEDCVDEGLIKSIGLSNFNHEQIQKVMDNARIQPANLQIEIHPYLIQEKLLDWCKSKGITVTAYSPLGSPDRPWAKPEDPALLEDPKIVEIAAKYNKSAAQVLIRWGLQRGTIVIPKSKTPARIQQNIQVYDFELSDEDMKVISSFNRNFRACVLEWVKDHPDYPLHLEF